MKYAIFLGTGICDGKSREADIFTVDDGLH